MSDAAKVPDAAKTPEAVTEPDDLARYVPYITAGVMVAVAVPVGIMRGGPAVVLWLAFGVLAGAVLLFWEALRTGLDKTSVGDALDADEDGIPPEQEARKRVALQALRDIDFERSIGRLSEEDHKGLELRYREEARSAMRAIDDGLGVWLARANEALERVERGESGDRETSAIAPAAAPEAAVAVTAPRVCSKCETSNDHDAVFCKKCAARVAPAEVADAP